MMVLWNSKNIGCPSILSFFAFFDSDRLCHSHYFSLASCFLMTVDSKHPTVEANNKQEIHERFHFHNDKRRSINGKRQQCIRAYQGLCSDAIAVMFL
jgi:hypothetical protein